MRSRLSLTAASGSPTIDISDAPAALPVCCETLASISTGKASMPITAAE